VGHAVDGLASLSINSRTSNRQITLGDRLNSLGEAQRVGDLVRTIKGNAFQIITDRYLRINRVNYKAVRRGGK